jgi:hypothetical protein
MVTEGPGCDSGVTMNSIWKPRVQRRGAISLTHATWPGKLVPRETPRADIPLPRLQRRCPLCCHRFRLPFFPMHVHSSACIHAFSTDTSGWGHRTCHRAIDMLGRSSRPASPSAHTACTAPSYSRCTDSPELSGWHGRTRTIHRCAVVPADAASAGEAWCALLPRCCPYCPYCPYCPTHALAHPHGWRRKRTQAV